MLNIDEIISRLDDNRASIGHGSTSGGVDYEEMRGRTLRASNLNVIYDGGNAGENVAIRGAMQMATEQFSIVYTVNNSQDAKGRGGYRDLRSLRVALVGDKCTGGLIHGWTPSGMSKPVSIGAWNLLFLSNSVLQWRDTFTTGFILRS